MCLICIGCQAPNAPCMPQVPRQASTHSCICCVFNRQAVCRRGSNHPFTGASEHAPPLPAEAQAQRWAEDYDSYKVS